MIKQLKLSALLVALLASVSTYSVASVDDTENYATKRGYSADKPTDAVSRNNYGECWKTNYVGDYPVPTECGGVVEPEWTTVEDVTTERVTLSADVLFAFDKDALRPEASGLLNEAIAKGKSAGARLTSIKVIGHTDSIGTDKYNDALSLRRANTVRNYLINNGIASEMVTAEGRGKREAQMTTQCNQQVAKMGKLSAAKKRLAMIDCLKPDRRVDIEFTGTVSKKVQKRIQVPAK